MSITTSVRTSLAKTQSPVRSWGEKNKGKWVQWGLIGIVIAYVSILILAPLTALTLGAFEQGFGAIIESFNHSFVLTSFWNTLWISLVVVIIHAVFGTIVAWVFVRHRFPGRNLINALVDMPFAISPVVAGYMLLLLFGRNGLLAPLVEATGIRVAFAFPGMLLATLFVTFPF
ncbi:MAG TPA: hypothetical protein VFQ23_22580, partial [Anaerolineales bacterium]|nr:hypothetical protein [Anaerolineales bacterium]